MAEQKKITKKEKNELLLEVLEGKVITAEQKEMLVEHINHEIDLLARKTSKSATPTKAQEDALAIAEIVKDILAECTEPKGMTVGAILKDERIKSYVRHNGDSVSSQVVTAILSKNTKDFVNTKEKKVSYYALAYGVADEVEG